jgi:hypothetical protein
MRPALLLGDSPAAFFEDIFVVSRISIVGSMNIGCGLLFVIANDVNLLRLQRSGVDIANADETFAAIGILLCLWGIMQKAWAIAGRRIFSAIRRR